MGNVYGKCKSKGFRITKPWKCVDFRIDRAKYPAIEQQNEILKRCRACDHYDVCPDCVNFEPLTK